MNVEFHRDGTVLTALPDDRLDSITAPELEKTVSAELDGVTDLILDLEKVEYVSSAGLRAFLALAQSMEDRSGGMKLRNVNDFVSEVLSMTGFRDFLAVE